MDDDVVRRWAAHGLIDPDGPTPGLVDVLRYYESVGIDPATLAGTPPDELIRAVNSHLRNPSPRMAASEARRRSGLADEVFDELCRAAGYDPGGSFTEDDVEAFAAFGVAIGAFSTHELLHVVRVMSNAMERVVHALLALIRIDVLAALDAGHAPEVEFARKNHETAQLLPLTVPPLRAFLLHSLDAAVDQSDAARDAASSGADVAVACTFGFVDIAGYTTVVETVGAAELARYMLDFESVAHEIVGVHGGQLVKLIGDEVMFATVEPDRAFAIAEALVERFDDRHGRPSAGLSFGEVVARGGDYYGRPVNLAARATALARPGQVLTDAHTAGVATRWAFSPIGAHELKGFGESVALCELVGARDG